MGNKKALVLVVLASLFSVSAVAAEKLAVFSFERAIFGSDAAQAIAKEATQGADFVSLKAKYEGSVSDFQSLAKELESNRLTWSQEQSAAHQKKMGYAKADAELAARKMQEEEKQLKQKIMQQLAPVAQKVLQEVIQEEGITLLLNEESVVFSAPESSLTAKVADRMNQQTK